jgi:hypothetical protein
MVTTNRTEILFDGPAHSLHFTNLQNLSSLSAHQLFVGEQPNIQNGARNDPVFDLVLIIQPCDEQRFVTRQHSR